MGSSVSESRDERAEGRPRYSSVAACGVALLLAGLLLAGCGSDATRFARIAEQVAAAPASGSAMRAYQGGLAALIARDGHDRLVKANGLSPSRKAADLSTRIREADRTLAKLAKPTAGAGLPRLAAPADRSLSFDDEWRTARATLYLAPAGPSSGTHPFAFSGLQALRTEIKVVSVGDRPYRLRATCDGPIAVDGTTGLATYAAGQTFLIINDAPGPGAKPVLLLPREGLTRCTAEATFADGRRRFEIVREEAAYPRLATLDTRFDVCALPDPDDLDPLRRTFYASRWLSETCPFMPGRIDILADKEDGFEAKVAALLGQPLPPGFIEEGNPEAPIDFSKAPRLSLIYVSYLDIKADFSGRVINRLLRHHASRGTPIRIMASEILTHGKDRAQLEALASDHLNVALKSFRWQAPQGDQPGAALSELHKVHHVKMLAALSPDAGRSVAIIGGRNIHDGFLFPEPVDLSAFPKLQQYEGKRGLTLNYYSNWSDIDIALHDDDVVTMLAAHLSTLWHDDAETFVLRPFSVPASGGKPASGPLARHFISVPYADGRALETYYVELIDAARQSIEVINPYLNLTPAIEAAIRRALARGVEITIIGRIDMDGDLGGAALTALNSRFVADHADQIAIYDYLDEIFLLHGKVLMIDGKLTSVSSVNLNNRSFIHDSENGVTVLDPAFYRRMKTVFEEYRRASKRLTTAEVSLFWNLIFKIRLVREAL